MTDQPTPKTPVEKLKELHGKIDSLISTVTVNGSMSLTVAETLKVKLEDVIRDLEQPEDPA